MSQILCVAVENAHFMGMEAVSPHIAGVDVLPEAESVHRLLVQMVIEV